jgi:epsilon-lactone hydrolase
MSRRAELLRLGLRLMKKRQESREVAIATVRRRLKRLERIVPRPPKDTQTAAVDAGGVNAVRVAVRQARGDRCVLYFHGGGYAFGTAALCRDFTWRIGAAAHACVLYFDYRLAPEHPFPAAIEDAATVYRWLASRFDPRRIALIRRAAGSRSRHSTSCATKASPCPAPWSRFRPGPISRSPGRHCNRTPRPTRC